MSELILEAATPLLVCISIWLQVKVMQRDNKVRELDEVIKNLEPKLDAAIKEATRYRSIFDRMCNDFLVSEKRTVLMGKIEGCVLAETPKNPKDTLLRYYPPTTPNI